MRLLLLLLLLLLPVVGAKAVHVEIIGLLPDVRHEAEDGKSAADEVRALWLLVEGKARETAVAARLHSV